MTREEAIKVLENPDVSIGVAARIGQDPEYWRKLKPALDMAISALRAQQIIHVTDLYDEDGGDVYRGWKASNDPLTMAELRQMDGEPVWVVCNKGFEPMALWALVEVCEESIFLTNNLGGRTEYAADVELECDGITVYRRKPEEGTK